MKIGFVIVFVSDFDKSFDFYTNKLGMPLDYTDKNGWAQFHAGEDISLAIEQCDPNRVELGSKLVGRLAGVTLIVDNIDDTYARLSNKGVIFTGKPEKQPWGGTLAQFQDPDGNILTLMESRDD
jgi:catechol 2,3-dioxygenase-like lactoylglutathione lyase family enzyme